MCMFKYAKCVCRRTRTRVEIIDRATTEKILAFWKMFGHLSGLTRKLLFFKWNTCVYIIFSVFVCVCIQCAYICKYYCYSRIHTLVYVYSEIRVIFINLNIKRTTELCFRKRWRAYMYVSTQESRTKIQNVFVLISVWPFFRPKQ